MEIWCERFHSRRNFSHCAMCGENAFRVTGWVLARLARTLTCWRRTGGTARDAAGERAITLNLVAERSQCFGIKIATTELGGYHRIDPCFLPATTRAWAAPGG